MRDLVDFVLEESYKICHVKGRQIIDSRGRPTVEAEVATVGGGVGISQVPAGASKGAYEAWELRDNDPRKFKGYSVLKAVENINNVIAKEIVDLDSRRQRFIDRKMIELDGTPNKSKLGANAILAVSMSVLKAAADTYGIPLFRYIGGYNARVLPVDSFREAIRVACEVYYELENILKEKYGLIAVNVGDEGGFAPPMKTSREALDALVKAIRKAGYVEGSDVALALDAAATSFYSKGKYFVDGKHLDPSQLLEYYIDLVNEYPIVSIEDPFYEEDFETFSQLTSEIGNKVLVVGDDLFVTNISRLKKGIEARAANAILIKMNQIGTVSETLDVVNYATKHGYRPIISHRSGETEDYMIADLAVGLNVGAIKTGAPARGERTVKYNRLLRISEILAEEAEYAGFEVFPVKPK
ncbi:MAG: phosphopyruvate hydratase [Desulfurococcales archaeon ex4484_217_1]|nr:MAG: phosphopyruvate hydratase [Desulfurococcales archaeon ex4484_217_1]